VFAPLANALARWRWPVIAIWAIVGVFAAVRAGRTIDRLQVNGGANQMTEARVADSLLAARFPRPLSEFFAVTVEGPGPMDSGVGGALLDSLLVASERLPSGRGTVSWRSTADTTFLSHDRHDMRRHGNELFGRITNREPVHRLGPGSQGDFYWFTFSGEPSPLAIGQTQ